MAGALDRPPQTSINEQDEYEAAEHFRDVERQLFDESDGESNNSEHDEEKGFKEEVKQLKKDQTPTKKSPKQPKDNSGDELQYDRSLIVDNYRYG